MCFEHAALAGPAHCSTLARLPSSYTDGAVSKRMTRAFSPTQTFRSSSSELGGSVAERYFHSRERSNWLKVCRCLLKIGNFDFYTHLRFGAVLCLSLLFGDARLAGQLSIDFDASWFISNELLAMVYSNGLLVGIQQRSGLRLCDSRPSVHQARNWRRKCEKVYMKWCLCKRQTESVQLKSFNE